MIRSLREVELFFLGQFYRLVHADQGCTVLAIVQSEGKKYTLKWTKIVSCTDLNSLSPLTIFLVILRQRLNVCKGFCLMIEFVSRPVSAKALYWRFIDLLACKSAVSRIYMYCTLGVAFIGRWLLLSGDHH